MIKELKRILGAAIGSGGLPGGGVIGRVGQSASGNTILEIGTLYSGDSWTRPANGGHIALQPEEREELIEVLESHRGYRVIKAGDMVGGVLHAGVLAVQYYGTTADDLGGTVLAYSAHKREYWVWSVNADGVLAEGAYSYDSEAALNRYAARSAEHLYSHFNRRSPALTFGRVPDADKLKG